MKKDKIKHNMIILSKNLVEFYSLLILAAAYTHMDILKIHEITVDLRNLKDGFGL